MLLRDLFEAEADDREARDEANEAFDRIYDYVSARADYLPDVLQTSTALGGSFVMKAERAGVSNNHDLLIVFSPRQAGGVKGAFGHAGIRPLIMLVALKGPNDLQYLDTRLAGRRGTFVHEWMHYRAWARNQTPSQSSSDVGPGSPQYYNHTEELNAYYQEAVQGFERLVRNVIDLGHRDTAIEMWGSKSTQELVHYVVTRELGEDFRLALTPANLQRIKKRISRFIDQTIRPLFVSAPEQHQADALA
jgi:hypothetical protein